MLAWEGGSRPLSPLLLDGQQQQQQTTGVFSMMGCRRDRRQPAASSAVVVAVVVVEVEFVGWCVWLSLSRSPVRLRMRYAVVSSFLASLAWQPHGTR